MSRLIALLAVFGGIFWLWQRWQKEQSLGQDDQQKNSPDRLTQCSRCDAMLPSNSVQQREVANSCNQGDDCPLKNQQP